MTFPTISSPLARALAERNYDKLTPVQTAVLADDAADRDLLVSAQTGSGKTVAYGLAIAKNLLGDAERFPRAEAPLALIVAPTRELALQVHRELTWLYHYADARIVSCVGGMDPRREQRELAEGAHIVVGTPGRLCDHLRRGRLDISELKAVVLDEADEMLDLGFREDMEFILETTPETRRTLLFSATFPRGIITLAKQYQQQAFRVEVARSADEQAQGLMFRTSLPADGGMLFPFPKPKIASFWMKNTLIPLDMIFVRADGSIDRIAENTIPESLEPVVSGGDVAAVLELAGGTAARLGLDESARVTWKDGK